MSEKRTFEELYYQSQLRRHGAAARKAAQDLAEGAALVLRALDAGHLPTISLSEDAAKLTQRIAILEAIEEMHEAYTKEVGR